MVHPKRGRDRVATPVVLIEHSDYWHINKGDLAMLDVTIERIRARWPGATVYVLTEAPLLLMAYFPAATPVEPWSRHEWRPGGVLRRACRLGGPAVIGPVAMGLLRGKRLLQQASRRMRRAAHLPRREASGASPTGVRGAADPVDRDRPADVGVDAPTPPGTARAVRTASLVLALGGGYLADADPVQSRRVLDLLRQAQSLGTPTALVGQGIGPIEEPGLLAQVARVLPRADYVGLREGRTGPELLARAGVMPERFAVTGDDAIELSHRVRQDRLGTDIGVCLRIASFSPVSDQAVAELRLALHSCARDVGAHLQPILISSYAAEDRRSTAPLIEGFESTRAPLGPFVRPQRIAEQVAACRVMVTGAYHAAVFALAQGIPVVALSTSQYYDAKFLGLDDMFGTGIELVRLDAPDAGNRLRRAISTAWHRADEVRAPLRARSREQIEASRDAVTAVLDLVAESSPQPLGSHDRPSAD